MKKFLSVVLTVLCFSTVASAQAFYSQSRIGSIIHTHATVGTSTTAAISSGSVGTNILSWKICNDAVNTSTYLYVGKAADVATDGVQLDKGACFECPNCTRATLLLMKVKAQAADNGYSVVQYKQQ